MRPLTRAQRYPQGREPLAVDRILLSALKKLDQEQGWNLLKQSFQNRRLPWENEQGYSGGFADSLYKACSARENSAEGGYLKIIWNDLWNGTFHHQSKHFAGQATVGGRPDAYLQNPAVRQRCNTQKGVGHAPGPTCLCPPDLDTVDDLP